MFGQSLRRSIPVVGNNPHHFSANSHFFVIGMKQKQWKQTFLNSPSVIGMKQSFLSSPSRTVFTASTWSAALSMARQSIYTKFPIMYSFYVNTTKPLLRHNFSSCSIFYNFKDNKDDKKKVDKLAGIIYNSKDNKDDKKKVAKLAVVDEGKSEQGMNCPHCGLGFTSHEELQTHIDNTGVRRGGCRKLWRKKNQEDVRAGILKHVCKECGIGFKFNSQLEVHKKFHRKDRPYKCEQCDKAYKTLFGLNQHIKDAHSNVYPCPECGKTFTTKGNMEKHLNNVCLAVEHKFKCMECGETFNQSENLKTHIKMIHERQRPFTCEVCGSDFSSKQYLEIHKRNVHDNIRDYKCKDCGKEFKTEQALKNHQIRRHTGDWPYVCEVCEKGFLFPFELKKHMETRHHTKQ